MDAIRYSTSVLHEMTGKRLYIAREIGEFHKFMMVIVRNDDVFGIACHVNYLESQSRRNAHNF